MAGNARLFVAALMLAAGLAQAQETLRPEIGKPLQAAQELLKEGKYKDALGKVREADAVSDRTPYENYILDRMRGSAAAGAGDDAKLHLGQAYLIGSNKSKAIEVFKSIKGADGVGDLARLWAIQASHS